jgi:hypothetical protein
MNHQDTRFEACNVLDRIEVAASWLLRKSHRSQYMTLFAGTLVGRWFFGLVLLLGIPVAVWLIWTMGAFAWISIILLFLLGVLLLTGLIAGLSEVALYQSLARPAINEPRLILQQAWSQIGSWFAYIGWAALLTWGIICIPLLLWIGTLWSKSLGIDIGGWLELLLIIIGTLSIFWGLWLITSIMPGKPEYILSGQTSLRAFLELRFTSSGRWWRVWGNFTLASIITGLVVTAFSTILSDWLNTFRVVELVWEYLSNGLGNSTVSLRHMPDITSLRSSLVNIVNSLDTAVGFWSFLTSLVSLALSVIVTGFLQAFNYVVGQDIATQAATSHENV